MFNISVPPLRLPARRTSLEPGWGTASAYPLFARWDRGNNNNQVAGEQTDQYVGVDAVVEAVVDGPQVQVVGLDDAEVALDVGEVLVALHHGGGVEALGGHAGA